jgi:flavin-dependent dehydrogenase
VRAYVRNVAHLQPGRNEFYIFKQHLPGYFWIFPLADGWANVGFGMLSRQIARRRINLNTTLQDIMQQEPNVRQKFAKAEIVGPIRGFGLPLGSRLASLSGDGFMLLGDAGSLVDPLQGHGIDKAVLSAKLAAEQAMCCFTAQRFDAAFMQSYDREVYQRLQQEFQRNYRLMQLLHLWPGAVELLCRVGNWPLVQRLVKNIL